jgi:hypothetical protein
MLTKKLLLFAIIILPAMASAQGERRLDEYLQWLFQGFPLDSSREYIQLYIRDHKEFSSIKNWDDSTKTDHVRDMNLVGVFKHRPVTATLTHFYIRAGDDDSTSGYILITALSMVYDKEKRKCNAQFKILLKELKAFSGRYEKQLLRSMKGRYGKEYNFYRKTGDEHPYLTMDIAHRQFIYIAYVQQVMQ